MAIAKSWAEDEFGKANLGDARRVQRLVQIAAAVEQEPAGKLTEVFAQDAAQREAGFRFMENDGVDAAEIAQASHLACARRAAEYDYVFVPTDGSSLNITDRKKGKSLGVVGSRSVGARGLEVMSSIAVSPDGVPLGICGQVFWARVKASKRTGRHDRRRLDQKETQHWLTVMGQTRAALSAEAPKTKPWFQLDRGGDAWPVILEGLEPDQLFTVRASYNRRLWEEDGHYLWNEVETSPVLGEYRLEVVGGPNRRARTATMEVRATMLTLLLQDEQSKRKYPATLFAVLAREISPVPKEEKPLEWLLLTTHEVKTLEDARLVIFGYAQRWRIEQFHRAWKSGRCNVEETQLGTRDNIERWATILAAVAVRIVRLTYLARHEEERPASLEFEPVEIKAVVLLREPKGFDRRKTPTVGQMVRWLADLGGYTGKSSGGPPGAIVIARGLDKIQSAVTVLRRSDQW